MLALDKCRVLQSKSFSSGHRQAPFSQNPADILPLSPECMSPSAAECSRDFIRNAAKLSSATYRSILDTEVRKCVVLCRYLDDYVRSFLHYVENKKLKRHMSFKNCLNLGAV